MRSLMRFMGPRAAPVVAVVLSAFLVAFSGLRSEAADWQAGAGADWTELLAAAKREGGKVVLAGTPALSRPLSDAFKRDTGLDLEFLSMNASEITPRLLRELQSGNVSVDLSLTGASDLITLYPHGYLIALKPQMILPGVKDGPQWAAGKSLWVDNEGQYLFRGTRAATGRLLVNSSVIAPDAIKNWKDLLLPQYKGKIAAFDPTAGGQGQGIAGYLVDRFGVDFLTALYVGQEVRYTRDERQLLDWIAHGAYPIGLGTAPVTIERFRTQGLPLLTLAPKDGPGYLSSGFSVLKEIKGAPHPKTAAVFINWYASAPGQAVFSSVMLEPSTRADVATPDVPDYTVPKPGVDYTDTYSETWYKDVRPVVIELVVKALGGR